MVYKGSSAQNYLPEGSWSKWELGEHSFRPQIFGRTMGPKCDLILIFTKNGWPYSKWSIFTCYWYQNAYWWLKNHVTWPARLTFVHEIANCVKFRNILETVNQICISVCFRILLQNAVFVVFRILHFLRILSKFKFLEFLLNRRFSVIVHFC